jgi:hypothetical protein
MGLYLMNSFNPSSATPAGLDPVARDFYRTGLLHLNQAAVPFLVGGAYALEHYAGIFRHTKDFDIFVRPRDRDRVAGVLAAAGCQTDHTYPHWLSKAFFGEHFIDIVFNSGNGICMVDDEWFEHAVDREVLGIPVRLCPPEEMIWSKAFILERERYDGADIAHILRTCAPHLAWPRILRRFAGHWRILLSHLVLFGFIYPSERASIPNAVMHELMARLARELDRPPPGDRRCGGTLLSREQYLTDVMEWGYRDTRLPPGGTMTLADIAHWTAAIGEAE